MTTAKATVNDLDETLERAATEGDRGLSNLQDVLARLATTAQTVGSLVEGVRDISDDFKAAATAASTATGNLERVVQAQNSVVDTVTKTASDLGTSLTNANTEFKGSAQAMADTTKEMTAGVQNYSQQVAELHSRLDENLAKAIGSLNSTISELIDGLDDFLEEVNKRRT
jgi:ABC-type transporter Mla subunit MlaD